MKSKLGWIWIVFIGVVAASTDCLAGPPAKGLTEVEAALRTRQVTHLAYQISLKLDPAREDFEATTVFTFDFDKKVKSDGLFAELEEAHIKELRNGINLLSKEQIGAHYDGHRIRFASEELKPKGNRIEVVYSRAYVNNGNGLHRFKDVADGNFYHFNHFEAYYAHLVFPCFDQPDLKAQFKLKVEAPKDWEVISSAPVENTRSQDGTKTWIFAQTPKMSTYVLTLAAGPFKVWEGLAGKIPTRLLVRRSMIQYVEPQEWLKLTAQALAFYAKEFSFPYPYSKLDLILVPDFPAGAMENLGGITIGEEGAIFRSKQPPLAYVQRAATLTHEIAHMWFGDLVTMKWWNGLWLNESFATLMESLSLAEATQYHESAWPLFYSDIKRWAYWEDQLVTTHAIELPVADTDHARSNFDGITYGKGASVLKQLRYFLGSEKFRASLKLYFFKHAYGNSTLEDFMGALSKASKTNLSAWKKSWLETEGLNSVRADWTCKKGKIASLALKQSAQTDHPTLRSHRTEIGFYGWDPAHEKLKLASVTEVSYSGPETLISGVAGKPCPALVFPNQGDYDYVKVELDPVSLASVQEGLSQIEDRLGRQMLGWTLFDMVRDGQLSPLAYTNAMVKHLPSEEDPQILKDVLRRLTGKMPRLTAPLKRLELQTKIESFVKAEMDRSSPGSDRQLIFYKNFLASAVTSSVEDFLLEVLKAKQSIPGLEINQDRRWGIVQSLARMNAKQAPDLIAKELGKDKTDEGRKGSFAAETLMPIEKTKTRWFQRITRSSPDAAENKYDAGDLREAMWEFQVPGQEKVLAPFVNRYFEELVSLSAKGEDNMYLQRLTEAMYPVECSSEIIEKTTALINGHPELPAGVIKSLRINRQEAEICLRVQAL